MGVGDGASLQKLLAYSRRSDCWNSARTAQRDQPGAGAGVKGLFVQPFDMNKISTN